MNIDLSSQTLSQLQTWLAEAQVAYHKLLIGGKQASVSFGAGKSVTYTQADATKLQAWINSLQAEIDARGGTTTKRAPVRFNF